MSAPGTAVDKVDVLVRLDALAAELAARGWTSSVRVPHGRVPCLHARNPVPGAVALSEDIYAGRHRDGTWMFWWPWAEPIAESAGEAAEVIVRVLRAADVP